MDKREGGREGIKRNERNKEKKKKGGVVLEILRKTTGIHPADLGEEGDVLVPEARIELRSICIINKIYFVLLSHNSLPETVHRDKTKSVHASGRCTIVSPPLILHTDCAPIP